MEGRPDGTSLQPPFFLMQKELPSTSTNSSQIPTCEKTKRPLEGEREEPPTKGRKLHHLSSMTSSYSIMKPSQIPNPFAIPIPPVQPKKIALGNCTNALRSGSAMPRSAAKTPLSQRSFSTAIGLRNKKPVTPKTRYSGCSLVSSISAGSTPAPKSRPLMPKVGYQRKPTAFEAAKQNANSLAQENDQLRANVSELEKAKTAAEAQLQKLTQQQEEVTERHEGQLRAQRDAQAKLKSQNTALREENTQLRVAQDRLRSELDRLKEDASQVEKMRKQIMHLREENQSLQAQNEQYGLTLERTKCELSQRMAELLVQQELSTALRDSVNNLEKNVEQKQEEMAQMDRLLKSGEALRRRMHNTIQELKGNIRVYCRVRPVSQGKEAKSIQFMDSDDKTLQISLANAKTATGQDATKDHLFQFDKVFPPESTNAIVFEEISQLVQSALDGYRVCIFAYGQTGSGKTFTMEGPQAFHSCGSDVLGEQRGMIPRAVNQIFETSRELEMQGWKFTLSAQFLEIYNEQIRDLLAEEGGAMGSPTGSQHSTQSSQKIEIKHDRRNTTVTNVKIVPVSDATTVCSLLKKASKNRSSAATHCNDRSSRSHSVFTLTIDGINTSTQQQTHGVLNLIDLAGSERLHSSGAVAERQKETQHINKSLACLGDVIAALAAKQSHIPFRNSKLTYLLQNCLGGDAKTLMFVNISPDADHAGESLCSLRFAAKVNSCEIGTAKRNVVSRD